MSQVRTVDAANARAQVADLLAASGHPDVVNMVGGVLAWTNAGFELSSGAPVPLAGN